MQLVTFLEGKSILVDFMKVIQWMEVENDKYELPIACADTAKELAVIVGSSENSIYSSIAHAKAGGYKSRFIRVEIEVEDCEGIKISLH